MSLFKMHKLDPVFFVTELINASYYNLPKNFAFEGETHDFWELTYVDRGEIIIRANQENYLLKSGEMVFYMPNEFHSIHLSEGKPASIVVIAFNSESPTMDAFEHKILVLGDREKRCLSTIVEEATHTFRHFDNIPAAIDLEQAENPPFGSEQIIKNRLEELFIRIYRRNENIAIESRAVSPNRVLRSSALVLQVQDYLSLHYGEKLSLGQIAAEHNVSETNLRRTFKEQTGSPVLSWLTSLRISEAKRMIQEGNLNFTQIAEAVGYDSIYYFSAVFKKQTGMTLTEFSRSVKANRS